MPESMPEPIPPDDPNTNPRLTRSQYRKLNDCLTQLAIRRLAMSSGAYNPAAAMVLENRARRLLGKILTQSPKINTCATYHAQRFPRNNIDPADLIGRVFEQIVVDLRKRRLRVMMTQSYLCKLIQNAVTTIRREDYRHQKGRLDKSVDDLDLRDFRTVTPNDDPFSNYNDLVLGLFDNDIDQRIIDDALAFLHLKSHLNWLDELARRYCVSSLHIKTLLSGLAKHLVDLLKLSDREADWLETLLTYGDRSVGWHIRLAAEKHISPSTVTRRNKKLLKKFEKQFNFHLKHLKRRHTNDQTEPDQTREKNRSLIRLTPREFYRLLRWVSRSDDVLCKFYNLIENGDDESTLRKKLNICPAQLRKLVARASERIRSLRSWEQRAVEQYQCLCRRNLDNKLITALAAKPRQQQLSENILRCAKQKRRVSFDCLAAELHVTKFAVIRTLNLLADLESAMTTFKELSAVDRDNITTLAATCDSTDADTVMEVASRCMTSHRLLVPPDHSGHFHHQYGNTYSVLVELKHQVDTDQLQTIHTT